MGLQAYDTEGYENVTVLTGSGANNVQVLGTFLQNLSLSTGAGNDAITLNDVSTFRDFETQDGDPPFHYTMSINGGSGFNVLSVNDVDSPDRDYYLSDGHVLVYENNAPQGMVFDYDNIETANYFSGDYGNEFYISGTSADIPAGQQTTIYGGSQQDLFVVYPRDAAGNPTIHSNIGILGRGQTDVFSLDDSE